MKTYWGSGITAPRILNLGHIHAPDAVPQAKEHPVLIGWDAGWAQIKCIFRLG